LYKIKVKSRTALRRGFYMPIEQTEILFYTYYIKVMVDVVELGGLGFPPNTARTINQLDMGEIPKVEVVSGVGGSVSIRCRNNSGKIKMPDGAYLMEVRYAYGATAPTDASGYAGSFHFSKASAKMNFDPQVVGSFVYLSVRWCGNNQNNGYYTKAVAVALNNN
jgi:hypothetical protein